MNLTDSSKFVNFLFHQNIQSYGTSDITPQKKLGYTATILGIWVYKTYFLGHYNEMALS